MLFTHFGVSGPVILSASSRLQQKTAGGGYEDVTLHIDLKPALAPETLNKRLLRDFEKYARRQMGGALADLLPKRLIPAVLRQAGISPEQRALDMTREQRRRLAGTLKDLSCTVTGCRGMEEAIITMGGVDVREINPSTMESRLAPGLYFAGEVLDVDAVTGGYNLQIAFSTGAAAGRAAAAANRTEDERETEDEE